MAGGLFCMQAARIQTSSQPISQEDLQIPLGRSADPTRIAATCLVLTRDKRLILPLKKKMWCFPKAAELICELEFFFMYAEFICELKFFFSVRRIDLRINVLFM
jgi:hypothetical protein